MVFLDIHSSEQVTGNGKGKAHMSRHLLRSQPGTSILAHILSDRYSFDMLVCDKPKVGGTDKQLRIDWLQARRASAIRARMIRTLLSDPVLH